MHGKGARRGAAAIVFCLVAAGCSQSIPPEALKWTPETMSHRQLQTRRFDTDDEAQLLQASAGVLQDLGFTLDESETEVGLIAASKSRDARETGKMVGAIILSVLASAGGNPVVIPWDNSQEIRVSLVTRPHGKENKSTIVRVTFQRVVWDNQNNISKLEQLTDSEMYQGFFQKLSTAIFLEDHQI